MARKYDPEKIGYGYLFATRPRKIITYAILSLTVLNAFGYLLLPLLFLQRDLIHDSSSGNYRLFMFIVGLLMGSIFGMIAILPLDLLPRIWDRWKVSSFMKFPASLLVVAISIFGPGFASGFGFSLMRWLGMPLRATGWWIGLWG